jgi:hypothetical protein
VTEPCNWMKDEREIQRVTLADGSKHDSLACAKFERFERPGEYCYLPWLRIHDNLKMRVIEVPLTQVAALEFGRPQ